MDATVVTSDATIQVNTSQKVLMAGLQAEWDASTDPEKNTFVDANEAEILTFVDTPLIPISVGASGIFDIYDALADGLTLEEKYLMTVLLDREIANSNQAKEDQHAILSLSGTNSLVDYIGGKLLTAVNAPTHSVDGYAFNGTTQHINSNFTPSTDGVNYTLNDAMFGVFVKVKGTAINEALMGLKNGATFSRVQPANPLTSTQYGVNGTVTINTTTIDNESLIIATREDSSNCILIKDGVASASQANASSSLPAIPYFIGAQNNDGSASAHSDATISSVIIASAIGFNQSAYNTNLRALLTGLGTLP